MARPLRIEYEGALYHVTARGNERSKIFFTKKDYQKFKEYLSEAESKYGFLLHAYVLMTTHYHLIIETPDDATIRVERPDGLLAIAPQWDAQQGEFGYARRLRYIFSTGAAMSQWPNAIVRMRKKSACSKHWSKSAAKIPMWIC